MNSFVKVSYAVFYITMHIYGIIFYRLKVLYLMIKVATSILNKCLINDLIDSISRKLFTTLRLQTLCN